jgi:hypothetical protein
MGRRTVNITVNSSVPVEVSVSAPQGTKVTINTPCECRRTTASQCPNDKTCNK